MTGWNDRGGNPGRGIAGVVAVAMLLALGAQGAVGAPSDKAKSREEKKGATQQAGAEKPSEPGKPAPKPDIQPGTVSRSIGGVQVAIDPATGRLRPPTADEALALAAGLQHMLSRETDGLAVIERPDGSIMVSLDDTFQEVAMANVDRKGRVKVHCVNDAARAMAILDGTAPDAPDAPVYGKARAADKKAAARNSRDAAEKE